ncbi:cell wall-binding repeat-containing protein [Robertmurraya massiliosenegalensis]|uniref:cell wall-binding repeat-containing protein n=1 Tax=Robertmurraya TaxID=2837507 RepID=UPI0039A663BD
MQKFLTVLLLAFVTIALAACSSGEQELGATDKEIDKKVDVSSVQKGETSGDSENASNIKSTKNVTRLDADSLIEASVQVSQTIWPATENANKPGAVILAPVDNWQIALASADLIHHPNNGPVLFYEDEGIPEFTLQELERLSPTSTMDGIEVMVMGNADQKVLDELKDYQILQIEGEDPVAFAVDVDKAYADAAGEIPQGLIIVSSEEEAKLYSLIASNWIAHMPEPILYVTKDEIPDATIKALELRNKAANIYMLGPESVISADIEESLKDYGMVTRIGGETPVEVSVEFAKFKDEKTGFGWGINEPGHGFGFISTEDAGFAVAGAPFAHLGKHAPLIWLENGEVSDTTHEFLGELQPKFTDDPTVGPYNHGFIVGSGTSITIQTQGMIDQMLEITSSDGGGHGH